MMELELNLRNNASFVALVDALEEKKYKDFNIFKILRVDNYEIRHSNILAWLLDKKASHNLSSTFIKEFLQKAILNFDAKLVDEDIKIKTEYGTDEKRRIDILIIGESFTCTIENKYGSCEHDEQCKHYLEFINKKFKDKNNYFIFLDTEKPENFESETYQDYHFISHKDILEILIKIVPKDNKTENIFLKQYIEILDEKYNSTFDKNIIDFYNQNSEFIKKLSEYERANISEKERSAIYALIDYENSIRIKLEEKIKRVLDSIVENPKETVTYHRGWAYKITLNNQYINQIDYRVNVRHNSIDLMFFYGINTFRAKNLITSIDCNKIDALKDFSKCFELRINDAYGRNIREILCKENKIEDFIKYWKNNFSYIGKKPTAENLKLVQDAINSNIYTDFNLQELTKYIGNRSQISIMPSVVLEKTYSLDDINQMDENTLIENIIASTRKGLSVVGCEDQFNQLLKNEYKL